jgi:hypothetical protein
MSRSGAGIVYVDLAKIGRSSCSSGDVDASAEVAGEEPKVTLDDLVRVDGLVFRPWVNKKGELVSSFTADAIGPLASGRSAQAA